MAIYRKKPVEVEAIKLDNTPISIRKALEFQGQKVIMNSETTSNKFDKYCTFVNNYGMFIDTLEGTMIASIGDYIIKGVNGEFYPCKPDIFKKTYEFVKE